MQTIITTPNLNEARKQIQKLKKENPEQEIAVLSQDEEFNRKCLEIKGINMLIINENYSWKTYSKQQDSGLNEVLAKIAAKSNIKIGIQVSEIAKKSDKDKARSLSRLKQNLMLCKKTGARIVGIGSFDKRMFSSLLLTLGASTKQAKALNK